MKKLFLIDAYALIFKFHYAFITSPMRNSEGKNVSAVFGFVKFINELLEKEQPEYIGVAFDPKGGNFRHEIFPEYKANREATPEDIIYATPIIKDILRAMNIPVLEVAGYEADDVIGTLCRRAAVTDDFFTYMVTPDKDYGQLVCERCAMYKPGKSGSGIEVWGKNEICEHFGVSSPIQVIDILAIAGDAADNIPGVSGIGPKGAQKLIAEYGSVEGIVENLDKIAGKTGEKVRNSLDAMVLSKTLATIALDVPIEFNPDELKLSQPNCTELREIYRRHNFRMFIQRMDSDELHSNAICNGAQAMKVEPKLYSAQKLAEEATQTSLFDTPEPPIQSIEAAVIEDNKAPETEIHTNLFDLFDNPPTAKVEKPIVEMSTPPRGKNSEDEMYKTIQNCEHNYIAITTIEELEALVTKLQGSKFLALDTETTSLEPLKAKLVGLSLSIEPQTAYWIPTSESNREQILSKLKPLLESKDIIKIGQNIKYDMLVLRNYDIEVGGELEDTMIIHYLLDPEGRHSLDMLARNFLGYSPISIEELIGKGKNQLSMEQVPLAQITDYAAEDADITLQLHQELFPLLKSMNSVDLYKKIEAPLIEVLVEMERNGVKINTELLSAAAVKLNIKLTEIEEFIYELAEDRSININSAKQLGELLFDKLALNSKAKKTKTGQYKTDEKTLSALKGKHEIVDQILEYRTIKKLLSTYIEALPELINPSTGRVHTSFNQATTATGRLSSSNPNLQNIPIREEMGREIRRAFVAEKEDWVIMAADYSQVELRIMAHLSGDESLQAAFLNGEDIHTATAAKIFGMSNDEVTSEMRRQAKSANFGIIYGISTFGLAEQLEISRGDAKALIDGYFASYPGVHEYMERVKSDAKEMGYVETIFGRRRYLADINSSNAVMRGLAERNAINAPIQGSAADIMKLAMIECYQEIKRQGLEAKVILQIHDEILIEAPRSEVQVVKEILEQKMSSVVNLKVPLTVEVGIGDNWLEAH